MPIFKYEAILYHGRNKVVSSRRIQFPLSLAWALTIHKVQGQTVHEPNRLVIHWTPGLQKGMGYVMLSRAKSLQNIYITYDSDLKKSAKQLQKFHSELHKWDKPAL